MSGVGTSNSDTSKDRTRKPSWLRVKALDPESRRKMTSALLGLNTVCEEANCPNIGECWGRGTATFMIMGSVCTRKCSFCAVATGKPGSLNPEEPMLLAKSAEALGLRHVVITSVNRDDLPDGGAEQFVACIQALRSLSNPPTVEVLTPDFQGNADALYQVLYAFPEVYNHNVETVPRLYRSVRIGAHYEWSIEQLRRAKDFALNYPLPVRRDDARGDAFPLALKAIPEPPGRSYGESRSEVTIPQEARFGASSALWNGLANPNGPQNPRMIIKSGFMLGLGETVDEAIEVMMDLKTSGVDVITIGQYLKPLNEPGKHEVVRYVPPEEFDELADIARELGFLGVASGPLVRSSYFAEKQLELAKHHRP